MAAALLPYFLWLKAFHIIFVVCWFAGIFYLPRLFVNHAMAENAAVQERLLMMETKLYRFITPFMWLTLLFGILMAISNWGFYGTAVWFHIKITLVVILVGYHHGCGRLLKKFASGENQRSHRFYRIFNEIPVLILFAIVILVVVKPV